MCARVKFLCLNVPQWISDGSLHFGSGTCVALIFYTPKMEKKRFKNGKKSTLAKARKAVKQGRVHLVSVAWVAACAASNMLELESEYKIADTVRLF